jgi:hypothetical protein
MEVFYFKSWLLESRIPRFKGREACGASEKLFGMGRNTVARHVSSNAHKM